MLSMSCLFYRPQRSWGKVMFLHVSVTLFIMGYPSMHCRWYPSMPCSRSPGGVSRPTSKGKLRGLARGDLQAHTLLQGVACARGGSSPGGFYSRGETPRWQLLLGAVRILLECILFMCVWSCYVILSSFYCLHLLSVIVMCIVLCHDELYIVIVVHSRCLIKCQWGHSGVWGRASWYFLATSLTGIMVRFVQMVAPGPTFLQVPSNRLGIRLMGMYRRGHFVKLSRYWCT